MAEMAWAETAEGYRLYLRTHNKTTDTAMTYVFHLHPFWDWCGRQGLYAPFAQRKQIQRYLVSELDRVSTSTVSVRLASIKSYYLWLLDEELIEADPSSGLTIPKKKRKARPSMTDADANRLFQYCTKPEHVLLFTLGLRYGMRIGEIVGLEVANFHEARQRILLVGKGDKERWLPLDAETTEMIKEFIAGRVDGKVFNIFDAQNHDRARRQARRIMNHIAKKAGVAGFYPHKMRISFAHWFWRQTHDLLTLQKILGHADPATTAHYTEFEEEEEVERQMRRFLETQQTEAAAG